MLYYVIFMPAEFYGGMSRFIVRGWLKGIGDLSDSVNKLDP